MKYEVKNLLADNVPALEGINRLCFAGLSVTTLITANAVAMQKMSAAFSDYPLLSAIAAICIAFAVLFLFDGGLRKNLISAFLIFAAPDFRSVSMSVKFVCFFIFLVAMIRFGLSTGATFISSIFISDDLVEDYNTEGLEKMLADKEKTKQDITLTLSTQITDIRADAENRAQAILKAAIERGGKRWAELWKKGNSWIRTVKGPEYGDIERWRKGIASAEKEAGKIRAEADRRIEALQNSQTSLIAAETNDSSFATITMLKANQLKKAEAKESTVRVSLWMLDGLFSLMGLLTCIALVVAVKFREDYVLIHTSDETTLSQLSRQAAAAGRRIALSYMAAAVKMLDRKAVAVAGNVSGQTGMISITGRTVDIDVNTPTKQLPTTANSANKPANKSANNAANTAPNKAPNRVGNTDEGQSVDANNMVNNPANNRTETVVKVTTIKGKPCVNHTGRDGKIVRWTERDVRSNLSVYETRMNEARKAGKADVYENNKAKVDLMNEYLAALQNQ